LDKYSLGYQLKIAPLFTRDVIIAHPPLTAGSCRSSYSSIELWNLAANSESSRKSRVVSKSGIIRLRSILFVLQRRLIARAIREVLPLSSLISSFDSKCQLEYKRVYLIESRAARALNVRAPKKRICCPCSRPTYHHAGSGGTEEETSVERSIASEYFNICSIVAIGSTVCSMTSMAVASLYRRPSSNLASLNREKRFAQEGS
jgi:hypothetical protein